MFINACDVQQKTFWHNRPCQQYPKSLKISLNDAWLDKQLITKSEITQQYQILEAMEKEIGHSLFRK